MKIPTNLTPLQLLLTQHLDWPGQASDKDWKTFERAFIAYIHKLMLYDTEKLIQAMYRIDVDEAAFVEALQAQDAYKIAQLTLERELQKVAFREKYKSHGEQP